MSAQIIPMYDYSFDKFKSILFTNRPRTPTSELTEFWYLHQEYIRDYATSLQPGS